MAREKHKFKILAYVIMPEHVHLVIWAPAGIKMGKVIGEIKSLTARQYFASETGDRIEPRIFWQKRCYDHNCRNQSAVRDKIKYCHDNPVKRGLTNQPGNYKWSSLDWYEGNKDVILAIDDGFLGI
jgi:putative transposase